MAEWSVVAARDRKQCEEVPAEWRPEAWMQDCACRGLSWARHRTGQARYAAVGTQSGVEAACIETFLLLLLLLKPFFLARARALARLFSVRNELWSRGGPIGCSTPLCTTGPVQTGLSRSVKAERSQGACLHDRCLDTKNSSTTGKGTTRRGLFDGNLYTRPRFPWKRKEDDTCKISRWIDREEGKRNGRNGRETCF